MEYPMNILFHVSLVLSFSLLVLNPLLLNPSDVFSANFETKVLDAANHGRTDIGDINGDGINDIVLHRWDSGDGRNNDGALFWYRSPSWDRYTIKSNTNFFGDEVIIVDLDGDGDNDVVTSKGNRGYTDIWWYRNPGGNATSGWTEHHVGDLTVTELKDLEVQDMDQDGKLDIVIRNRGKFAVFFQDTPTSWTAKRQDIQPREGMKVSDLDGDGYPDVIMNGYWLKNPKNRTSDWDIIR